jgi:hypothetical protein
MRRKLIANLLGEYDCVLHELKFLHILVWHSYGSCWHLRLNGGTHYVAVKLQEAAEQLFSFTQILLVKRRTGSCGCCVSQLFQ